LQILKRVGQIKGLLSEPTSQDIKIFSNCTEEKKARAGVGCDVLGLEFESRTSHQNLGDGPLESLNCRQKMTITKQLPKWFGLTYGSEKFCRSQRAIVLRKMSSGRFRRFKK
jgi:hypothetical protein